jgi:tetratricopeptide (TPR) repeat protein
LQDLQFLTHCDLGGVLVELHCEPALAQRHLFTALRCQMSDEGTGAKVVALAGLRTLKQAGWHGEPGAESEMALVPAAEAVLEEVRAAVACGAGGAGVGAAGGGSGSAEADALFELGSAMLVDGQAGGSAVAAEAAAILAEAVEVQPSHYMAHLNLANAHLRQQEEMQAAANAAGTELALSLQQQQQQQDGDSPLDRAVAHAASVVEMAPPEVQKAALLVQAVATQRMASVAEDGSSEAAEKLEAAYGLLRRAIKLDAGFVDAHAHAADICLAQQRLEEATEHLRLATGWGLDAQAAPASVVQPEAVFRSGRQRLVLCGVLQVRGELTDALELARETLQLSELQRIALSAQQRAMLEQFAADIEKMQ